MKLKISTAEELLNTPTQDNSEKLVDLSTASSRIICKYLKDDMLPHTGETIFVRESVAEKLAAADAKLRKINPDYRLWVSYGYRHPEIQKKYYLARQEKISQNLRHLSENEVNEIVHTQVALPEVAGHPTGGAIDVAILDGQKQLDMGSIIADHDHADYSPTYSKKITQEQLANRLILHDLLVEQNFCPYYNEWWHFSYGDKEWAAFYNQPFAVYEQAILNKETL